MVALVGLVGGGRERRRTADAGVVDQVVERVAAPVLGERGADAVGEGREARRVGDVERQRHEVGGAAVVGRDHPDAAIVELLGGCAANA
nr:hypothetical protein [Solirubrobacter pauli]